jgi:hypothetical protein
LSAYKEGSRQPLRKPFTNTKYYFVQSDERMLWFKASKNSAIFSMRKKKTCVRLKFSRISGGTRTPGGALTKSADHAASMRTGGAIPLPAYTPPGAIEVPRRLC